MSSNNIIEALGRVGKFRGRGNVSIKFAAPARTDEGRTMYAIFIATDNYGGTITLQRLAYTPSGGNTWVDASDQLTDDLISAYIKENL